MLLKLPIIVLTPIKNEDWILDRFLAVTSKFADAIIIADQQSSDKSCEIASKYEKVHLIKNENENYDEAYRQNLLINYARQKFVGPKILLALDADEIMTADSLNSLEWSRINQADPGTVLHFEKPDLIFPVTKCIRYDDYFPIGYVDDGAPHTGKLIHSPRIPQKITSPRLYIETIKFMHYAHCRPNEYWARQRYYSVIERTNKVQPFFKRILKYSARINQPIAQKTSQGTPDSWMNDWKKQGIDMESVLSSHLNRFNGEVLKYLKLKGTNFYALDDIWDFNWSRFEKETENKSTLTPVSLVNRILLNVLLRFLKLIKK